MERKLEAREMWFHRRMLHISWKDHVTNDEVLRRGRTERKLMNRIRAGQMSFLGHIMRKHRRENIVVTGKIEGERSRGRPRLNFMKSFSQLLKISEVEIIERTRSREEREREREREREGEGESACVRAHHVISLGTRSTVFIHGNPSQHSSITFVQETTSTQV